MPATGADAPRRRAGGRRRRGRLRPAGRAQPRGLGGAARARRSASSASATSRRPPTRPTATRARPARLGVALVTTGPGRGEHAGRDRRGVGVGSPVLVDRDRHPDDAAPPRRAPRRAARVHRPGRHVRAGHQGGAAVRRAPRTSARAARSPPQAVAPPAAPGLPRGPDRPALAQATGDRRVLLSASRIAGAASRGTRPRTSALADAQRPLVWAGGGARRTASDAVDRARRARSARRSSPPTAAAGSPATTRSRSACRPTFRQAGALWDQADARDRRRLRPRRHEHPELAAARSRRALVAINVDPADAAKNYEPDVVVEGDAALAADLAAQVDGPREPWVDLDARCAARRWRAAPRASRPSCASSTPFDALPETPSCSRDMCIPGYWLAGLPPRAGAAAARLPDGLGHARLRLPGRAGRRGGAARRARGLGLRRRRLPVRRRRAGHARAGAPPAHRRDRRRRRLRDAALRPGRGRRERTGVDLHTPDFAALASAFGVRARPSTASTTPSRAALRAPPRRPRPSVLVAPRGARAAADDVAALVPEAARRSRAQQGPERRPRRRGFSRREDLEAVVRVEAEVALLVGLEVGRHLPFGVGALQADADGRAAVPPAVVGGVDAEDPQVLGVGRHEPAGVTESSACPAPVHAVERTRARRCAACAASRVRSMRQKVISCLSGGSHSAAPHDLAVALGVDRAVHAPVAHADREPRLELGAQTQLLVAGRRRRARTGRRPRTRASERVPTRRQSRKPRSALMSAVSIWAFCSLPA